MRWSHILISIFAITAAFGESSFTSGFGFSRLEQRYVLFEDDTISASNEARLFSEGDIKRQIGNNELYGNSMLSIGSETFWGRAKSRWRWTGPRNLLVTTQIGADLRTPYDPETASGYFKGYGYVRTKKRWADANGSAKLSFEAKDYTDKSSYSYDYTLSKLKFDFGFPFFGNDELSLGYQFAFRYAPDTTEANYQRNNFYANWYKFWGGNYLRGDFEAERRIYNRGDLEGNHWRIYIDLAPRIGIGEKLTLAPEFTAESYRYEMATSVYPNREQYVAKTAVEWSFTTFVHGGIGPKFLLSHADSEVETDNFQEVSLEMTLDWLRYRKIWLDVILEPGVRFYATEPSEDFSYYSDFAFIETSCLLAWWISPKLRLDALMTYSPEWHDVSDDNITTFYLSTNLKYEFFR